MKNSMNGCHSRESGNPVSPNHLDPRLRHSGMTCRCIILISVIVFSFTAFAAENVISKKPADFVDAGATIAGVKLDIRYFGSNNFIGRPIDGYKAPKCFLTKKAADALSGVQKDLEPFGLKLLIYDCYRPQMAVDNFARWAEDIKDTKMKSKYYPGVDKRNLFKLGFIAHKSGHTRGSTVDLTIDGINMGGHFDFFGDISGPKYQKAPAEARAARLLLKTLMENHGFKNYDKEWWHFTLKDEPYPETYFGFAVE